MEATTFGRGAATTTAAPFAAPIESSYSRTAEGYPIPPAPTLAIFPKGKIFDTRVEPDDFITQLTAAAKAETGESYHSVAQEWIQLTMALTDSIGNLVNMTGPDANVPKLSYFYNLLIGGTTGVTLGNHYAAMDEASQHIACDMFLQQVVALWIANQSPDEIRAEFAKLDAPLQQAVLDQLKATDNPLQIPLKTQLATYLTSRRLARRMGFDQLRR